MLLVGARARLLGAGVASKILEAVRELGRHVYERGPVIFADDVQTMLHNPSMAIASIMLFVVQSHREK